jgi:hypothetical protein
MSAYTIQTPGDYPKENIEQFEIKNAKIMHLREGICPLPYSYNNIHVPSSVCTHELPQLPSFLLNPHVNQ